MGCLGAESLGLDMFVLMQLLWQKTPECRRLQYMYLRQRESLRGYAVILEDREKHRTFFRPSFHWRFVAEVGRMHRQKVTHA